MKMKKSLMAMLAAVLAGTAWATETSADVLIWYIDTEESAAVTDGSWSEFDTIKFWAVDVNDSSHTIDLADRTYIDAEHLLASTPTAGTGNTITLPSGVAPTDYYGSYYTNLSGLETGYSFFMELYLDGQRVDRMIQPVTWDQFQGYMVSSSGLGNDLNLSPDLGLYNFASTMVPEPSSGLLLLIGGALLALRRRRVG